MTNDYSISLENPNVYVYGIADIRQCWYNILHTIPGSIPLMPGFGSDLFQYIDKPISQVFGEMVNVIVRDLEKWETRTAITKVEKSEDVEKVAIKIYGTYTATGEAIDSTISLDSFKANGQWPTATYDFLTDETGQQILDENNNNIIVY